MKQHDVLDTVMTGLEKDLHHDLLKKIENLTIKCFERANIVPVTLDDETQEDHAVPSTSGVTSTVNRTITVNEHYDPDEPDPLDYGTENTTYLDTVVNVSYSGETLPDLQDTMDHEVQDTMEHEVQDPMEHEVQDPMEHEEEDLELTLNLDSSDREVTIFRALNEKEQKQQKQKEKLGKFARLEKESKDSDVDEDK